MAFVPATITTELMEHADGRPIAYIDATAVAIFVYQQPDHTYVIDIHTRDDSAAGRLWLWTVCPTTLSLATSWEPRQSPRNAIKPCEYAPSPVSRASSPTPRRADTTAEERLRPPSRRLARVAHYTKVHALN
jgi:hypothetical protein